MVDQERAAAAIAEFLAACGLSADDPRLNRTPRRVAAAAEELLGGEGIDPVPMLREGRISLADPPTAPADPAPLAEPVEARSPDMLDPLTSSGIDAPSVEPAEPVEARPPQVRGPSTSSGIDASLAESVEASDLNPANLVLLRNIRFRSMCEHHLLPFDGWAHLAYLPGDSIIGFGRLYELVEICSSRLTLQENLGETLADALMRGLDARGALVVLEARQGCVADRGPRQSDSDSVTLAARGALLEPQARADALRLIALGGADRS